VTAKKPVVSRLPESSYSLHWSEPALTMATITRSIISQSCAQLDLDPQRCRWAL